MTRLYRRLFEWLCVSLLLAVSRAAVASSPPTTNAPPSTSAAPLGSSTLDSHRDGPLMKDIELLSSILSNMIKIEDPRVHDIYEQFRQLGMDRAEELAKGDDSQTSLNKMVQAATTLSTKELLGVVRTFTVMLNLVNSAEVQHRNRLLRTIYAGHAHNNEIEGPLPLTKDSIRGTIDELLHDLKISPDRIIQQIATQKVEIVLTAHPTQVQRKSLLRKYRHITDVLGYLDRPDLDGYERSASKEELQRLVSSIWGADEIRRNKPTVQQEAAGGNAIIESVLWDAVPAYLRKLDQQCRLSLGKKLPVDACPIRFASWIGGDRDGNPNVTPDVTREVVLQQRLRAARLLLRDMTDLLKELAISSSYSEALLELARNIKQSPHKREKYRRVLGHLVDRLTKTARECEAQLAAITADNIHKQTIVDYVSDSHWDELEPIYDVHEILGPLTIIYDSLVQTGYSLVADGALADIIRRLHVFGLSLVPLDIREESTKHMEAIDAITRWLGIGSYKEWSEEAKLSWLNTELSNKRPLYRNTDIMTMDLEPSVVKTLQTFKMASELNPSDLGAYVISQAQKASDVLAVMLLQKQYGMTARKGNLMRVVPLFETLDDLTNAPDVLETLFSNPVYVGAVKGKQEVMVGYSDSAKDAGRLAACWAQYNSQERMVKVGRKYSMELTFFHGKGGTVGRGGNPSVYRAIMSHPPNTINGRFRVTEQGEMITQNFGALSIAERTLDIYTAAVCRESFMEHVEPKKGWRNQMQKISDVSCEDYRHLVREEPRFVPYFRQATPELELGSLNIGSRPAKRNPKGGIESLRAIPWTFAWTQTRTHLSAWLGVGVGLTAQSEQDRAVMRDMYKNWPWFRETIDLISMIVSKTDFSISKNYDTQLVDASTGLMELGEEVRRKMVQTRQAVLDITEAEEVAGAHSALMRASSAIRHPYVDPINVMQAELLKRVRKMEKKDSLNSQQKQELEILKDALIISINGIAQGMRNSG